MQTGELLKRLKKRGVNVSQPLISLYEKIGLIKPAPGKKKAHKIWGNVDVETVNDIQSLLTLGFSLKEAGYVISKKKFGWQRLGGKAVLIKTLFEKYYEKS